MKILILGHVVIQNKTTHTFNDMKPNHRYKFVLRAFGHIVSDPALLSLFTKIEGVGYLAMSEVINILSSE